VSATEIRSEVHQIIDSLDEGFLRVVHSMLDAYVREKKEDLVFGYDAEGRPIFSREAEEKYVATIEEMKKGHALTVEQLKKEAETW